MTQQHNRASLTEYLHHLIDTLSESIEENPEDLREAIEEEGFDYDKLVSEGLQLIHNLDREQRYMLAKEESKQFLEVLKTITKTVPEGNREEMLYTLNHQLSDQQFAILHHKLESIEDEDLKSVIKEAEVLRKFKEQKDQEKSDE